MSKYLVTGGAGFIGSNLVDELIAQGHDVVIVDDLSNGKKKYINNQAKFYQTDICSKEIEAIFKTEKPDFVFHLAAQIDVRVSVEKPVFDNKVNIVGVLNILEAARKARVEKIIFTSTGGAIYGDCASPATELTLPEPVSPYAIHKYAGERYLDFYKELHGLKSVSLRLANIYGPRQYKGGEGAVAAVFTHNALAKKASLVNGDGLQTRDFVYVGDVVDACILAMKKDCQGIFNIGSGRETSIIELIKKIEKINGEKFIFSHAAAKPGEVRKSVLNSAKAKKILNWEPKFSLEEGIKMTLKNQNL